MTATHDSPENQNAALTSTCAPQCRSENETGEGSRNHIREHDSRYVQSVVDRNARLITDRDARINRR